jgi:hypothetical protein
VIEPKRHGVQDRPPEPVIGLAEGETRWRTMTALAVNTNFASHLNLIWLSNPSEKNKLLYIFQKSCLSQRIPPRAEGRTRGRHDT